MKPKKKTAAVTKTVAAMSADIHLIIRRPDGRTTEVRVRRATEGMLKDAERLAAFLTFGEKSGVL